MAYGDPHYEIIKSGSTTASANTQHLLFGNYDGLSNLNNNDVIHIVVDADNSFRYGLSPSNNVGALVQGGSGLMDIPATRVGSASQLLFANKDLGSNATVAWTIFRKKP